MRCGALRYNGQRQRPCARVMLWLLGPGVLKISPARSPFHHLVSSLAAFSSAEPIDTIQREREDRQDARRQVDGACNGYQYAHGMPLSRSRPRFRSIARGSEHCRLEHSLHLREGAISPGELRISGTGMVAGKGTDGDEKVSVKLRAIEKPENCCRTTN